MVYLFLIYVFKRQKLAAFLAVFVIFAYVMLAGAGIPVLRAGWMTGLMMVAVLIDREHNTLNALFLVYFVLAVFNTRSLEQISLQLSFLSIFSLIFALRFLDGNWPGRETLFNTLSVMAGTLPVIIHYFHVVSFAAVFTNVLAIPLFNLGILGGFVSILFDWVPLAGVFFIFCTEWIFRLGLIWLEFWNRFSWNAFYVPAPQTWQCILYYIFYGLILLSYYRYKEETKTWVRSILWSAWILIMTSFFTVNRARGFELTLLAAGKNEAAYFQLNESFRWLINAGRGKPSDQSHWIIQPFLRARGIQDLSGIILTDFKKRHTGGADTIFKNFKIHYLMMPQPGKKDVPPIFLFGKNALRIAGEKNIPVGDKAGVRIENAGGRLITDVFFENNRFIFLPDTSDDVFEALKKTTVNADDFAVLILPAFEMVSELEWAKVLDWVNPKLVLFSGDSPFGAEYFKSRGIDFFSTASSGALTLRVKKGNVYHSDSLELESFQNGILRKWDLRFLAAKP